MPLPGVYIIQVTGNVHEVQRLMLKLTKRSVYINLLLASNYVSMIICHTLILDFNCLKY